ncbi:hypothetical protein ATC00_03305 [Sinorhizobium americanum]|uniref:DUF4150 domain-containing protein n=1 Tax=Sinorhizobium americanum TaxID=194963 RepID=UPI0007D9CBAD|nr:DUF4150 domain-containing protein [Sinorhizobium americanum]OAP46079.1 hypothetical protein ATC00_03305 [Sinorhizobium americanum]
MSLPPSADNYVGEPEYPGPWTTKRPLEGLRDTDAAKIICLAPDVCLTPIGKDAVPIPYQIVDYCGHDQNYTPSVRFTGQKAMVLRSNTTHVHGDAPGTKKGIKSGAVENICEPIGHAAEVRAEGSNVIRHLDRFWMNNKNTQGEAIYVRNSQVYAAALDDDPVYGSLTSEFEPVQLAFDSTSPEAQQLLRDIMKREATKAARRGIFAHGVRAVAANPVAAGVAGAAAAVALLPPAVGYVGISRAQAAAEDALRAQVGLQPRLRTPILRLPMDIPLSVTQNVRVTEREGGCPIGPYDIMQPICAASGRQAHHVVPDRTFRSGGPTSSRLYSNAPSKASGAAVCVDSNRMGRDSEHSRIHFDYYDPQAALEAANGNPSGFIRLSRAEDLGSEALEKGTNGRCNKEYIRSYLRNYHQQVFDMEPDTLVRGQKSPLMPDQVENIGNQNRTSLPE